jgi:hypothetical protein
MQSDDSRFKQRQRSEENDNEGKESKKKTSIIPQIPFDPLLLIAGFSEEKDFRLVSELREDTKREFYELQSKEPQKKLDFSTQIMVWNETGCFQTR